MNNLEFVYNTLQVSRLLNIGRSTVNKYARSMEDAGYIYTKDDNDRRAFTEHDVIVFRALIDLLSRGVDYDSAINTITARYKRYLNSDSVAIVATTDSNVDLATLNAKITDLTNSVKMLSDRLDDIIDIRVKSEVAAAASSLEYQIREVIDEVRSAQEQTDQKMDEMITRLEKYKRKSWLDRWRGHK